MRGKICLKMLCLLLFASLPLISAQAQEKSLIGQETPLFSLPSTEDRLIVYANEYYGKHHLIMTFFPAAFTPV